jgi:hypothetical protein
MLPASEERRDEKSLVGLAARSLVRSFPLIGVGSGLSLSFCNLVGCRG